MILCVLLQLSLSACDLIKVNITTSDTIEAYNEGAKLYKQENYKEAHTKLLKAAEKGYAPAQNDIGWMYLGERLVH